jgi:hypothetical protein
MGEKQRARMGYAASGFTAVLGLVLVQAFAQAPTKINPTDPQPRRGCCAVAK